MSLPFAHRTFDCVTGGYALRNVPDIPGALKEVKRVLKPGGRFLSLDFGHPSNKTYRWLYLKYLSVVGSVVGLAMHSDADTYRYRSARRWPGPRGARCDAVIARGGPERAPEVTQAGGQRHARAGAYQIRHLGFHARIDGNQREENRGEHGRPPRRDRALPPA